MTHKTYLDDSFSTPKGNTIMMYHKEYLGDAVYIGYGGEGVILTTENGMHATNVIYCDWSVIQKLLQYLKTHKLDTFDN
jgi:hypothetical protein